MDRHQVQQEIERVQQERIAVVERYKNAKRAWERAEARYYEELQCADAEIAALHVLMDPPTTWKDSKGGQIGASRSLQQVRR